MKQIQKEEHAAGAKLFKGALGPAPAPKPAAAVSAADGDGAANRRSAANPAAGSSAGTRGAGGSSRHALLQPLFAVFAVLIGWLQFLVRRITQR